MHQSNQTTINRRRLLVLGAATLTGLFTTKNALANPQAPQLNNKAKSFVKLIALYRHPADVNKFEQHYKEVHIPLVLKTPHLKEFRLTHYTTSPTGEQPEFYMMAEEIYDSQIDLNQAKNSPELVASTKDMELLVGEIQTVVTNLSGIESQWSQ